MPVSPKASGVRLFDKPEKKDDRTDEYTFIYQGAEFPLIDITLRSQMFGKHAISAIGPYKIAKSHEAVGKTRSRLISPNSVRESMLVPGIQDEKKEQVAHLVANLLFEIIETVGEE